MRHTITALALGCFLWTAGGCGGSSEEPVAPPPDETSSGEDVASTDAMEAPPEPEAAPPVATPERTGSEQAPGNETPATYACRLADDFNQCIVERLEGRADTEAKMIQLIQSYRLLGRADEARTHMEEFVETYPDSPQAQTYRDYLGSSGF